MPKRSPVLDRFIGPLPTAAAVASGIAAAVAGGATIHVLPTVRPGFGYLFRGDRALGSLCGAIGAIRDWPAGHLWTTEPKESNCHSCKRIASYGL